MGLSQFMSIVIEHHTQVQIPELEPIHRIGQGFRIYPDYGIVYQ